MALIKKGKELDDHIKKLRKQCKKFLKKYKLNVQR